MTTPYDSRDLEAHRQTEGMQSEAAELEYGDSSALYWKLYASEAETSDQKLVETLTGDTNSMLILVRR